MKKETIYCGIDISCDSIDVCLQMPDGNFKQETFSNDQKGFSKLLCSCTVDTHFVMESTGVYHLPLCFYLQEKKVHLQRCKCAANQTLYSDAFGAQ